MLIIVNAIKIKKKYNLVMVGSVNILSKNNKNGLIYFQLLLRYEILNKFLE